MKPSAKRPWWRVTLFVFVMLVIEFLDEFAYSTLEAARPLIRDAFELTYVEISLVTTIPLIVAIIVEPIVGLMFDQRKRRLLMVIGAAAFGAGLILQGLSPAFWLFVVGAAIQAPASGVFVNLAQASMMDDVPERRENSMALWTFSGSLAVVIGPLTLTAALLLGSNWRVVFVGTGIASVLIALWIARLPNSKALRSADAEDDEPILSFRDNVHIALQLLKDRLVWRWLLLLEVGDLMLDVLFGLLALYFVDVIGVTQAQAGFAIAVWTGVGLLGDFLLIPLLEKVKGLVYLRYSALMILILYPSFLLIETYWLKLILLGIIGLFNAGWYAILQG
ncbi:MAG: MFS transporter, partial [Chloroflexota bacterium]